MREMKDAGSYNYVQDEASCIVFGMPREAIAHGAADDVGLVARLLERTHHLGGAAVHELRVDAVLGGGTSSRLPKRFFPRPAPGAALPSSLSMNFLIMVMA